MHHQLCDVKESADKYEIKAVCELLIAKDGI